jgi:L-iditol 2-dehydrogenase
MAMEIPKEMRGAMLVGPERIEIRKVPVPLPGPREMLVRIGAATTCGTDVKVFRRGGHPRMLKVPTLFGHELAGTVAEVGAGVSAFAPGDRVVVANSAPCGSCDYCRIQRENLCRDLHYINGAFAEYILVPRRFVERNTYRIPDGLPFEHAALTEPLACVLHGIEACGLTLRPSEGPAREVAVWGAGPIGLFFVAALARGGHRVVLADLDPARLETGIRLGAATTVQVGGAGSQAYLVRARTRLGEGAEVTIDATGVPEVWRDAILSARPGGTVNLFGGCPPGTSIPLDTAHLHYLELTVMGVYHHRPATVRAALDLLSEKAFDAGLLLAAEEYPIELVEQALRRMIRKEAIKVVVRP